MELRLIDQDAITAPVRKAGLHMVKTANLLCHYMSNLIPLYLSKEHKGVTHGGQRTTCSLDNLIVNVEKTGNVLHRNANSIRQRGQTLDQST
jgi:hypothetical protein